MNIKTLDNQIALNGPKPLHSMSLMMKKILGLLTSWHQRQKGRMELSQLDDRLLQDIGLTRMEMEKEIDKPFWVK